MNILEDPEEARRVWQDAKRKYYTGYLEIQKSNRAAHTRANDAAIRRYRRGEGGPWELDELADLILDDGTYLDEVMCIGDYAVAIYVGGYTGAVSFTDCKEIRGRQVRSFLKWKWRHRIPIIGRKLRQRWARKMGVIPERPSWVPKF